MSSRSTHSPGFPVFRRIWKPVAVTGAGGTAVVIWFEEIIAFGAEILSLILLTIMASMIYLLDIFIFRSRLPRREDMENKNNLEARK